MMALHSKLPGVGKSVFAEFTALAHDAGAINLGQGFPDFDPDPRLLHYAAEAMHAGHNQYAPLAGIPKLREQLADLHRRMFGVRYDPETEITLTAGATEAIFSSLQALVHPGDEVIYFEPAYDSYRPGIELAGGTPVAVPLLLPTGEIDLQQLADSITLRTRGIILNTPHNPTGTVLPQHTLSALAALADRHNLWVISDEVYGSMRYDSVPYAGVGTTPALRERSIWIGSFGKSLHATGWKMGYALAAPQLTAEIRKVHQFVTFSVPTPLQHAAARFISEVPDFQAQLAPLFEVKRQAIRAAFAHCGLEALPCTGTYFQCFAYPKEWGVSDDAVARRLIREAGVALLPLSPFYADGTNPGLLRACFAKDVKTLEAAGQRLRAWFGGQTTTL